MALQLPLEMWPQEAAARFLMHATFGPTREAVANLSSRAFSEWAVEEMALPPTLHRAFFRQRASPRLHTTLGTGGVRQPCQNLSRWHRYTMSKEDEGRVLAFSHSGLPLQLPRSYDRMVGPCQKSRY